MRYFDTSLLAAYYCPEALSKKAERLLLAQSHPAISNLTQVELFSAAARKVREGNLSRRNAKKALTKFLEHLDGDFYSVHMLEPDHYVQGRNWIGTLDVPLRSLDALHLAVVFKAKMTLVTSNKGLAKAGRRFSIDVVLVTP